MSAKVKTKMWYRARGCQHNGICKEWEGSIYVPHESLAVGLVRQLSCSWNAKEIYYIAIYPFDAATGEMSRTPLIWQSYDENDVPLPTNKMILPAPNPLLDNSSYSYENRLAPTKEVMNTYDDADWCKEFDHPVCFVTLKLKEQESEQTDDRG